MSLLKLPYPGLDLESELTVTQFVIPAGAGATFSNANSANVGQGGVCTVTFNAAHGLTLTPSAGVPPNYFITFGGSTSAITGTGVLVGNVFRILTIPSTTAITIWSTISTATVTSLTGIPVFFPLFIAGFGSGFSGGPTQTISAVVTPFPAPQLAMANVYARNGANCAARVNPDQTAIILDPQSTPAAGTPGTAPTWRDQVAASASGELVMAPPWGAIWANGTTATSTFSVSN
jgi:hypothetical protein